ncbi:hypothetical protein [Saccharopolyspora griseoalba]|uniref:Transketolase N-terminal domain-containing protein n=1 Tax=Saccharopolyspora griseoalba TaxID=1431848 RepID=A0ABW2LMT9_9PSEU
MTQVLRRALPSVDADQLAVAALRFLAADAVRSSASGAPGSPLGAAPMAWALWSRHLRHDPADPGWADRDRFVLSAEHGPALLRGLLHLFGYDLSSTAHRAPAPRERGHPSEPGRGLATAVGMALAERMTRARCPEVTDHRTYAILGACQPEESGSRSAALAARLGLGRLTVLWADDGTGLDGAEQLARFADRGWHVLAVPDGTDVDAIDRALSRAADAPQPSFVAVRAAADEDGDRHHLPSVPEQVRELCEALRHIGRAEHAVWRAEFDAFRKSFPERAAAFERARARGLPAGLADRLGARAHDHMPAPTDPGPVPHPRAPVLNRTRLRHLMFRCAR